MLSQKITTTNDMPVESDGGPEGNSSDTFANRLKVMLDRHFENRFQAYSTLGVSPNQLALWLAGKHLPNARFLIACIDLGIDATWLLAGIGDGYTLDEKGRFLASSHANGELVKIRRQNTPIYVPVTSEEAE